MQNRLNVLLVTDRSDLFNAMPSIMNANKYRTAIVPCISKAIELLRKIDFDIVYLVDISARDDLEAYQNIKKISPNTSVLKINMYDRRADWSGTDIRSIEHPHINEQIN